MYKYFFLLFRNFTSLYNNIESFSITSTNYILLMIYISIIHSITGYDKYITQIIILFCR